MWNQILSKVKAVILTNWSQFVMFILGALVGIFFLAGLVGCAVVQPAWDGVKGVTSVVVDEAEGLAVGAYGVVKDTTVSVAGTAESAVQGTYNLITDPFTDGE